MFHAVAAGMSEPILRMYGWETASVSLGRFQSIERTMNREALAAEGIAVVRRITGGRGILHGDDLTISMAAPIPHLGLSEHASVAALYEPIAAAFQHAFGWMGVDTCQGPALSVRSGDTRGDCFATISRADLIHKQTGIKLLGTALHVYRVQSVLLMQASLPLRSSVNRTWVQRLGSILFRGSASGNYVADSTPSFESSAVRFAVLRAFTHQFGITFTSSALSAQEEQFASLFAERRYSCKDWSERAKSGGITVAIDT